MPRRIRIEEPGFYHILNRGVERRIVFLDPEEKKRFLEILQEEFDRFHAVLHCYVLMDNHYHLLVETRERNLSRLMRQVNSRYAIYFNKTHGRVGHLWQDRFKSWLVMSENYYDTLFRYFELNPIEAGIADRFGIYERSYLGDCRQNRLPACCDESFLAQRSLRELYGLLEVELREADLEHLKEIEKSNRARKREQALNLEPQGEISSILKMHYSDREERDRAVAEAYRRGFSQAEIARHLGVSPSLVSKIVNRNRP